MVTVIKKGATKENIQSLLVRHKENRVRKSIDLKKYCGSIKLKEDPLELQKQWRNEFCD